MATIYQDATAFSFFYLAIVLFTGRIKQTVTGEQIQDMLSQDVKMIVAQFDVPFEKVEAEIQRRTRQEDTHNADVREHFLKSVQSRVSIIVGHQLSMDGNVSSGFLKIMVDTGHVSLGLAYFSTAPRKSFNRLNFSFAIDQVEILEAGDVMMVKRDVDTIIIQAESSGGCQGDGDYGVSSIFLDSWFPERMDFTECDEAGWNHSACNTLKDHRIQLEEVGGNFCFSNRYEGIHCPMRTTILRMTGIFREKSVIAEGTPLKSVRGYHFEGKRLIGITYPCFINSEWELNGFP